jgi:hypothetical protein
MPRLYQWNEIQDGFTQSIVLGNGASRVVSDSFAYESLLAVAKEKGLIDERIRRVFDYFKTNDFELVLRMLWHTYKVNQALGTPDQKSSQVYRTVRDALVASVREIHPPYNEIAGCIPSIARFLRRFNTVVSLNYDLIVHWSMIAGNLEQQSHQFKDCFLYGEFDTKWEPGETCTLVFYPHGNLALARSATGSEKKLAANQNNELLETVLSSWESGDYVPLFVSEGLTDQKMNSIKNSHYLSTVYEKVLPELGESVVIYGWDVGKRILTS